MSLSRNKKVILVIVLMVVVATGALFMYLTTKNQQPATTDDSSLPDISYWQTHKSNQFLIDMSLVQSGHPYKGIDANTPHTGAHVQFGNDYKDWPKGGEEPIDYPAIYAVADGIVGRVDYSYPVGDNDRYGVSLEIAKGVNFDYSIEPFVKEPSKDFYKKFIMVKEGQKVKKGQILAFMYLPKNQNASHIHFDLSKNGQFMAPAIFNDAIVQSFHDHWANFGYDTDKPDDHDNPIPVCMGYKLSAAENPFGTGKTDCLK